MRKKFLTALLTVTMFTCALMTACGSEKEVAEPKNENDVVVEETSVKNENNDVVEENVDNSEASEENETVVKDENTLFFFDMMKYAWENGEDFVVYTTQSASSETVVIDENTLFNAYVYEFKDYGALYKGCIIDENGAVCNTMSLGNSQTIEKVEFTHEVSTYTGDDNNPYVIEVHEMTYNCDIAFMDKNNDGVSEYAVIEAIETYDEYGAPDEMSWTALCYFSDDAELITVNNVEYWLFTTDVSETGNTYYSIVKAPSGAINKTVKLEPTDYVFENYMLNAHESENGAFSYWDEEHGYWNDWYRGNVGIYAGFNEDTGTYHKKESSSFEADGYLLIHK